MSEKNRISESEWKVMEVIWSAPPATAQDVLEAVGKVEQWKLETVKTLIGRLVKKGALSFRKQGNRYFYSPEIDRETAVAGEAESFLNRISRGSIAPLFAHLVEARRPLNNEEIAALRQLLNDENHNEESK